MATPARGASPFITSLDPGSCGLNLSGDVTLTVNAKNTEPAERNGNIYATIYFNNGHYYTMRQYLSVPGHDTIGAVLVAPIHARRGTFTCAAAKYQPGGSVST